MIAWNIDPFVAVGPVRFGALASEIHSILGDGHITSPTTPSADVLTDTYQSIGAIIGYDRENRVTDVEVIRPGNVQLGQEPFLGRGGIELINKLRGLGHVFTEYPDGYIVDDIGVFVKVEDDLVKSCCAFSRSEFERYTKLRKAIAERSAARAARRRSGSSHAFPLNDPQGESES